MILYSTQHSGCLCCNYCKLIYLNTFLPIQEYQKNEVVAFSDVSMMESGDCEADDVGWVHSKVYTVSEKIIVERGLFHKMWSLLFFLIGWIIEKNLISVDVDQIFSICIFKSCLNISIIVMKVSKPSPPSWMSACNW